MAHRPAATPQAWPPLSRLAPSLEPRQRLNLEAVGLCTEIMRLEIAAMSEVVSRSLRADLDPDVPQLDQLLLFRSAWSIVDRAYALHKLLNAEDALKAELDLSFDGQIQSVADMRNAMDHLEARGGNFAAMRKAFPVFGILTFCYNHTRDLKDVDGRPHLLAQRLVMLWASSAGKPWNLDLRDRGLGVAGAKHFAFQLHAFDCSLSLPAVCTAAQDIVAAIEARYPPFHTPKSTPFGSDSMVVRGQFAEPIPVQLQARP